LAIENTIATIPDRKRMIAITSPITMKPDDRTKLVSELADPTAPPMLIKARLSFNLSLILTHRDSLLAICNETKCAKNMVAPAKMRTNATPLKVSQ